MAIVVTFANHDSLGLFCVPVCPLARTSMRLFLRVTSVSETVDVLTSIWGAICVQPLTARNIYI